MLNNLVGRLPMPQKHKDYDVALLRILSIFQRLLEGKTLQKKELAEEFNVSEKTIQRDINKRLQSYPITYSRNIGWQLDSSFASQNTAASYHQLFEKASHIKTIEYNLLQAKHAIEEADAILILAGAGMGVDSGLPDFRGDQGFWKAYPPMKRLGLTFYDIANPLWFTRNPSLAWGFYGHRINLYRNTTPHKGFALLKSLVDAKDQNYFIFTSNVDGQFQKAKFDEAKIFECHGSIHFNQCTHITHSCSQSIWSNSKELYNVDLSVFQLKSALPTCVHCGQIARPNVLMFGDFHFSRERYYQQQDRFNNWLQTNIIQKQKIVLIEIGAGIDVLTVRRLSEEIMCQYECALIRINPRDYQGPKGVISIPLPALESLEHLIS